MKNRKYHYFALLVCFIVSIPAKAEISAENIMNQVYSGYVAKKGCWIGLATKNKQYYCMKIDRNDGIIINGIKRHYIIATGIAIDENGEENGAHVTPGMVGAFVVEERNGQIKMLAGNSKMYFGPFGQPPEKWIFVKLGSDDYWGWQNTSGNAHYGITGSYYHILAPYGKSIRDIAAQLVSSYDDTQSCDEDTGCKNKLTSLTTSIEFDSTKIADKVFPLTVTVRGKYKGNEIDEKTFTIPFDEKKWEYLPPKNYFLNQYSDF